MQVSTSPTLVPLPFADSGAKNVIPEAASPTPGLASLTTGFPPVTMTPLAAGGIPPAGQDMNGILNLISQTTRWTQAGGPFAYNTGFATDSNVNGYPQGAVISRADYTGQWISTVDNNTVNPDTIGTNWVPGYNYGVTAVTGLTNANVTLTPAQAAKNRITLAGTLTGNVQIIFPTWTKDWTIVNNTTGAFTATAKTAAGTGVAIPQDGSPTKVVGDGTNITQLAENVAPATQSQHAVQLAQVGHGQCQLQVQNSTTLALVPYNGNNLIINGVPRQIPAGGATLSNSGLSASTLYYIYAQWAAGAMSIVASTTAHLTSSTGIETMIGDATKSYVGIIYMNASSQFSDSGSQRFIRSWFNKQMKMFNTGSQSNNTSSVTNVQLSTTNIQFVAEIGDAIDGGFDGFASSVAAGGYGTATAYVNGVSNGTPSQFYSAVANANGKIASWVAGIVSTAGLQIISLYGASGNGSNCVYNFTGVGRTFG